jgi:hypothetical protein
MSQLKRILEVTGEHLAEFWLRIVGIVLLLSFPIGGFVASFFVGWEAAWLVGFGTFGVVVFFLVAFFFGLFLSMFVWQPHVKQAMYDAIGCLK